MKRLDWREKVLAATPGVSFVVPLGLLDEAQKLDAEGSVFSHQRREPHMLSARSEDFSTFNVVTRISPSTAEWIKAQAASVPGPSVFGRDVRDEV